MKKYIANIWKKFVSAWKAETPKVWIAIRNASAFVTIAIPFLDGLGAKIPGASVPAWFTEYSWYAMGIAGLITLLAGTRQKKVAIKNPCYEQKCSPSTHK